MTPSIFPVLRYQNARAAIDWLVQAFGFEKHREFAGPDDTVAHAEIRFGPSVIGLSSATPPVGGNPWSQVRQGIYITVDDVDSHYERARHAQADIVVPLRDMDYGSREYTARDPDGMLWGFGTYTMGRGDGRQTLFPEVHYRDPRASLAFLCDAFGFTSSLEVPDDVGGVLHAELRLNDDYVMVGALPSQGEWSGLTQLVCTYVPDPDRHYQIARAAGAKIARPPENTPYGSRQYAVRDPEGFVWLFGTYRPQ
jgi:uncharacterized glyoxalase superfamily protein PhnB